MFREPPGNMPDPEDQDPRSPFAPENGDGAPPLPSVGEVPNLHPTEPLAPHRGEQPAAEPPSQPEPPRATSLFRQALATLYELQNIPADQLDEQQRRRLTLANETGYHLLEEAQSSGMFMEPDAYLDEAYISIRVARHDPIRARQIFIAARKRAGEIESSYWLAEELMPGYGARRARLGGVISYRYQTGLKRIEDTMFKGAVINPGEYAPVEWNLAGTETRLAEQERREQERGRRAPKIRKNEGSGEWEFVNLEAPEDLRIATKQYINFFESELKGLSPTQALQEADRLVLKGIEALNNAALEHGWRDNPDVSKIEDLIRARIYSQVHQLAVQQRALDVMKEASDRYLNYAYYEKSLDALNTDMDGRVAWYIDYLEQNDGERLRPEDDEKVRSWGGTADPEALDEVKRTWDQEDYNKIAAITEVRVAGELEPVATIGGRVDYTKLVEIGRKRSDTDFREQFVSEPETPLDGAIKRLRTERDRLASAQDAGVIEQRRAIEKRLTELEWKLADAKETYTVANRVLEITGQTARYQGPKVTLPDGPSGRTVIYERAVQEEFDRVVEEQKRRQPGFRSLKEILGAKVPVYNYVIVNRDEIRAYLARKYGLPEDKMDLTQLVEAERRMYYEAVSRVRQRCKTGEYKISYGHLSLITFKGLYYSPENKRLMSPGTRGVKGIMATGLYDIEPGVRDLALEYGGWTWRDLIGEIKRSSDQAQKEEGRHIGGFAISQHAGRVKAGNQLLDLLLVQTKEGEQGFLMTPINNPDDILAAQYADERIGLRRETHATWDRYKNRTRPSWDFVIIVGAKIAEVQKDRGSVSQAGRYASAKFLELVDQFLSSSEFREMGYLEEDRSKNARHVLREYAFRKGLFLVGGHPGGNPLSHYDTPYAISVAEEASLGGSGSTLGIPAYLPSPAEIVRNLWGLRKRN